MVHLLVQEGADVNLAPWLGVTRTPLQRAAENGDFAIVEYLLEQGAIVDTVPALTGGTALQLASIQGFVGIATLLLEKGAGVNFPAAGSKHGRTAFEGAAKRGRVDMMSLLMKWGAES
ncbi:ankyrin [Melanomma pulvis-pyrius CBS 109.77]|uniref:Ankyrin n=1 Tax=Melanomma pulvis-pyrius CBS 109.77 TaxID=1314802 RepID=A0A6A6XJA5_9PLEO|nr:ankyrin [Melanomma pulvis-pyrius CBS 109.77]